MDSSWDQHKDVLRVLYLSKDRKIGTLRGIMAYMASEHNFIKSKGQYERQFQKWGLKKNSTALDWKAIHGKIEKRQKQGKASVVYRSGRHVRVEKLNKEKRHDFRKAEEPHRFEDPPAPPTPEGFAFAICTPIGDNAPPVFVNNFPSLQLFGRLESLVTHAFPNLDVEVQDVHRDLVSGHWNASSDAFHELFQASRHGGLSPLILPMLHLASNNLLSEGQASDVMDSLLQSGSRSLFNALISPQSPATKAIARSLLSSAIKSMDVPMVRSLLDTGISPDSPTSYSQERPLKLAVRVGCMEVARLLLHYGAQVNLPCFKGSSLPLTIAANDGALKLVQLLLGAGADVNAPGGHGIRKMTALQIAAAANRSDIVQLLLGAGANINAPALGDSGQTALQAASRTENIALVELLLSHGADVNAPVSHFEGRTALQAAAQTGNTSLVELLLSHGADVNALGTRGTRTALQWAASAGDVGLVQLLLEWGALDILDAMGLAFVQSHIQILQTLLRFGQTLGPLSSGAYERMALKAGARCGDYRFVRQLLESRTEVDAPAIENDTKWTTGLQEAARRGHKDIAQLLITFGADVNAPARGDGGLTALQGAALKGDVEMVKILLCAGADVNAPTSKFGEVALTMAVKSKSLEIAKLLLASGAHLYEHSLQSALGCESSREIVQLFLDHNLEHDNNLFMVHSFDAIKAGDNELIYLLLEYEALDEARSLTDATYASNFELVEVLLKFGAEVNDNIFFNDEGFALEAAASLGNLKIMNLLLGHGANAREKARALQAAANENQVEAARLLISSTTDVNNAPLNVMDWENGIQASPRTAMQAAAGTGNLELVQLLLGAGADVESKVRHEDEEGTALQFAAISGSISVASFLIEHGADVNAPPIGKYGRSALEGAAEHGRLDMVQLLLNVEAEVRGSRAVQFARNEGHDGVVQLLLENDLKAHG